jgi:hypothetical protein
MALREEKCIQNFEGKPEQEELQEDLDVDATRIELVLRVICFKTMNDLTLILKIVYLICVIPVV